MNEHKPPTPDDPAPDDDMHKIVHDIRHCLYVIGMAVELLKHARDDDDGFMDICESIEKEKDEAAALITRLVNAQRPEAS